MKVSKLTEKVYLLRVEHPCADRGIYQIYTIQDEQARWLDTYTSPRKAAECISLRSKQNHPKRHFHTPGVYFSKPTQIPDFIVYNGDVTQYFELTQAERQDFLDGLLEKEPTPKKLI